MKKKIFTFLFAMVASIGNLFAYEVIDGICYELDWIHETAVVVSPYYDSDNPFYEGNVIIPSQVIYDDAIYDVIGIADKTFYRCKDLNSITIPNSVTSIGDYAFNSCYSLTSIEIPNSVTSIGQSAFQSCWDLTSVTIGNSVTSIGDWAFDGCNLKSVTIPHSVTHIGEEAFYGNSNLQTITINSPSIVEQDEELLQWAFDIFQISEIIIGDGITKIGKSKFYGFGASFTIPSSVTSIGNEAFSHCDFKSIIIPNSVTEIGSEAFAYNNSLEYVTLPNNIKELYRVFNYCTNLKSIDIPNGVTSLAAFEGCKSLLSVTIPNTVTYLSGFGYCPSLTSIDIPESVKEIGYLAFIGCINLKSVRIPDSVTRIGEGAFRQSGITSITIPVQIETIGDEAFYQCGSLDSVVWNVRKAVFGPSIFQECKIKSLVIGEDVDSLQNFYDNAYNNIGFDLLESVVWNAKHCEISLRLPQSIKEITFGGQVEYIPAKLCWMNQGIKKVIIPNSVKTIGREAFHCDYITTVIIGEGLIYVGDAAFRKIYGKNGKTSSITCYAKNPPIIGKEEYSNEEGHAFDTDTMFVPTESVNAYKNAYRVVNQWSKLLPIGATPVETDDIHITPSENYADIIWKAIANAASYELVIEFMGNTWRFVFDADGILTSIANHAPARYDAPRGTQSAGFSYTVMGLASGTTYNVTITAKAANGSTLNVETASFTTSGEPQGIEDVNINNTQSKKIIRDGNVYILRGDKVFTLQGQEVK